MAPERHTAQAWPIRLATALLLAMPWGAASSQEDLPRDFELSEVAWGGYGGGETREDCGTLTRHPVILVHGDAQGPEAWQTGDDGGVVGALRDDGFGPCEVWALRTGEAGTPLRSLEELTDDVKVFIHAVIAYTGAPRVQLIADGAGAVLVHATLRKYALHDLVHAVVYLDGPFGGLARCDDERCFAGEVLCCALRPGSSLLGRTLLPLETPHGLTAVPDHDLSGHLRYLVVGSTPAVPHGERTANRGSWMLDGAWNLSYPEIADNSPHHIPELWSVILRTLSDPAAACTADHDADGDGHCALDSGGNDCNDTDPHIHPGAPEVEADGVDQDCNRHDLDRSFVGWKCERPLPATEPPTSAAEPPAAVHDERDWLHTVSVGLLLFTSLFIPLTIVAYFRGRSRPH